MTQWILGANYIESGHDMKSSECLSLFVDGPFLLFRLVKKEKLVSLLADYADLKRRVQEIQSENR